MVTHSAVSPTVPSPARFVKSGSEGGGMEASSGGESDWTGTGEDWTGTSSDSAFINYIRSKHLTSDGMDLPGNSPSPPSRFARVGSAPHLDEMLYTQLNQSTINEDNHYSTVNVLSHGCNDKPPLLPPLNKPKVKTLVPLMEITDSSMGDDDGGYCKMVSNTSIRTELKQRAEQLPSPCH